MWGALFPFLLQISLLSCVLADGTYECGDHGRFEYCIDEIPGCVIGCHCHPGYYFDTDTKICEPNTKLIEHHRRNVIQPARIQNIDVTPNVIYDTEPASSTSKIDGHVDDITKDANDLGDWLYNQFFKTIENQVINGTNDKDNINRRSGSQPPIKKPKRSKKWRKGGKPSKQREKKKQLRRKLLRITENDSLFDISSKSSSDSSDSSSSGDISSTEYEVNESNNHKHDDDEHGHKKIVMINKKPKQPLPSFIFLPNLETPFYPPIGLPPPPIVPMYPMVPVPPVPLCPITGCIENADKNVATTSSASTTTTAISTISTVTSVPSSAPETTTEAVRTDANLTTDVPETPPKIDTKALRIKKNKKKKAAKLLNGVITDTEPGINNLKYIDRQKILERLKKKMSNHSAKLFIPSWKNNKKIDENKFATQNEDAESPFLDNLIVNDEFSNNEKNSKLMRDDESFPDAVDFKYITELIHRVDLSNKSNDLPPIDYPLDSIESYQSPKTYKNQFSDYNVPIDTPDGRRINRPLHHKSDESYYANLGRQIATMIRGIDTKEKGGLPLTPNKIKNNPYNSPTSFWERSVRSPLTFLKTKNKRLEFLKRSNELLFDIENKVEIIASTAPSLTLQEIENIVKVMEVAKKDIQIKNKSNLRNQGTSHKNLDFDLWPKKSRESRNSFEKSVLHYLNKIGQGISINKYKTNKNNIESPNGLKAVSMQSFQKSVAWKENVNENIKPINESHNIPTRAKPSFKNNYFKIATTYYNLGKPNKIHQLPAVANPFSTKTINRSFLNKQVNPYFLRHKKYFQDDDNFYVNQNVELPRFPPVERVAPVLHPSYFTKINHFDYMD